MNRVIALLIAILFVSCSGDPISNERNNENDSSFKESVMEFNATVKPVSDELLDSKSYLSPENVFSWVLNDKLGFWPASGDVLYGDPVQVVFHVTNVNGNQAYFKGNGWGIARGTTYHSYYPYNPESSHHSIPISYTGQNPQASGNTSHLGSYDYLCSTSQVPYSGEYTIEYNRIGTIARFLIDIPAEYVSKKFCSLELGHTGNIFVESAQYDPTENPVQFSNKSLSNTFSMKLGNDNGILCGSGNKLEIYAMMFPVAWANMDISVTLKDSENGSYSGTFHTSKNQESNKRYLYTVTNLCYDDGEEDLSKYGAANCYIVSTKGAYKFSAVEGNTNTAVDVKGVKVLWESDNTSTAPAQNSIIKSNVTYENGYIHFSTNETFKKGNAVIAAYSDAGCTGNILWSWHIWLTDKPADHEYKNDAGYLMDRNLGALSTDGDLSAGLFYQWGRKDPFMGTASISSASAMQSTVAFNSVSRTASNGTVAWATAHPTTFIYCNGSPLDWMYTQDATLWYNNGEKTKYDPCPPGYKVITGSSTADTEAGRGFWAKALGINWRVTNEDNPRTHTYITPAGNLVFADHILSFPIKNGNAYYPATGCITDNGGKLDYVGSFLMLWTDYPAGSDDNKNWNTQYSGVFDFNPNGWKITLNWNSGRAAGKNVRCMVEQKNNISASGNEGLGTPEHHDW